MESLSDAAAGRYGIVTVSGAIYILDLDVRIVVRFSPSPVHDLSLDGVVVSLLTLVSCEIGERMELLIDFNLARLTLTTTPVLTIKPLAADEVSKVPEQ